MLTKVRIGPIDFKIRYVEGLVDEEEGTKCKLDGAIKYSPCEILIEKDMDPQRQYEVLLHEVAHGVLSLAQLRPKKLEAIVSAVASGFMMVSRDNPHLWDPLKKAKPKKYAKPGGCSHCP